MLALEKKTRQNGDSDSTLKIACSIVQLSFDAKDFEALNNALTLLSKRRGQFKRVILKIVSMAVEFVERLSNKNDQLTLINTLRAITEGKIFVENERARLTRQLARMKEAEGDVKAASKLMQELQVETYNTMDKKEKTDYILEQMRLCLDTNDFARAQIISRKISERLINLAEFQKEKERYYLMMVRYYSSSKQYLDICRSYLSIYNTAIIKAEEAKWVPVLQKAVAYVVLARFGNEQNDLSVRISQDKALDKLPVYKSLLSLFLRKEIMHWPTVLIKFSEQLKRDIPEFAQADIWKTLESRVVEHNIRIIASYYRQVTLERLAELIHQTKDQAESHVSSLVNAKMIYAKIDRPRGIVTFREKQNANELMEAWSSDIKELLTKLDQVGHQVHRELVVHKVALKSE